MGRRTRCRGRPGRPPLVRPSPPALRCTTSSCTRRSTHWDCATLWQLLPPSLAAADASPCEYVTRSLMAAPRLSPLCNPCCRTVRKNRSVTNCCEQQAMSSQTIKKCSAASPKSKEECKIWLFNLQAPRPPARADVELMGSQRLAAGGPCGGQSSGQHRATADAPSASNEVRAHSSSAAAEINPRLRSLVFAVGWQSRGRLLRPALGSLPRRWQGRGAQSA